MRSLSALALFSLAACTPLGPAGSPRESRTFEAADVDPTQLRFTTWNINTVGFPGDTEYESLVSVVNRLQPDVLALNEIEDDEDAFITEDLAVALGYDYFVIGDHVGFGDDRNAILSRYPLSAAGVALSSDPGEGQVRGWTSASLSGQSDALDISRAIVGATVHTPVGDVGMVSLHWKSGGSGNNTEFRRAVEVYRTMQALDAFDADHLLVSGDLNVDVFDNAPTPSTFTEMPGGFPARFVLGSDLSAEMSSPQGLVNHPHALLESYGLVRHPATQADGSEGTRPSSGRVLDYVYTDAGMVRTGSEIYNSLFDDRVTGVDKAGDPLDALACADTSDHLPVVVDFDLGSIGSDDELGLGDLTAGDLRITEVMPDPWVCPDSTGEWIEVRNESGFAVDLDGLVVADASGNQGLITDVRVGPGGLVVFARSSDACDATPDASYGDAVTLNNSGDEVHLLADGRTIASLSYGSAEAGESFRLDDTGTWCSGAPSPGEANAACEDVVGPDPDPSGGTLTVSDLSTGDLLFTELMANPETCSDSTSEWVELLNTTASDIDLGGVVLEDASGNAYGLASHVLPAGERVVVARSATACDVTPDLVFGTVTLNNSGDSLYLYAGTTVVDSVTYDAEGGASGYSWSRDGAGVWCTNPFPTAGSDNPVCF